MDEQQANLEDDLITVHEATELVKKSEITLRGLINKKKLTNYSEPGIPIKYSKISKSQLLKLYPVITQRASVAVNRERMKGIEDNYEFLLKQVEIKDKQILFLQEEMSKNRTLEYAVQQFEESINILRDQITILREQLQNKDEQIFLTQSNFETSQKRLQVFEKLQFNQGFRIENNNLSAHGTKEKG